MSIATKRGDGGETGLAGGIRVSKSSLRVETYGTVDELNSALGLARSMCDDADLRERTKRIQRELFRIGSALATPPQSSKPQVPVPLESVEELTGQVYELEATEGLLSDWSLPGETVAGAAYDLARTVCRRAERCVVRLMESGEAVEPNILAYLNRLSDLLWLFARKVELGAGEALHCAKSTGRAVRAGPAHGEVGPLRAVDCAGHSGMHNRRGRGALCPARRGTANQSRERRPSWHGDSDRSAGLPARGGG